MPYLCHLCHEDHDTGEICIKKDEAMAIPNDVSKQKHYTQCKIQPAVFIAANDLGYFEGNVIKYVCRYKLKNGAEDLRKARHYLDMLIEKLDTGEVKL